MRRPHESAEALFELSARQSETDGSHENLLRRSPSQEFDKDEDDDSVENDPFHIYDQTLSRIGIGKFHYQLVAVMGWGNAIDAINLLTVSFIIPELEDEWHFSSYKKGLLSSSIFLGMLFGGWIFSGMADRYGRRPVILCTLVIEAIFSLASSLCHTIDGMIIFRFFSGVGVGGSFPVAFAYFAEFLPLESRGSFIVLLASFWTLGNVLTATMAWIILPMLGWRYFVVICVIPTVICMIMIVTWAPESPRYLLTQNRIEEAQLILRRIAQVCGYHHVINLESLSTQSLPPPNDGQFGSWDVYKQLFSPQLWKTTTSIVLIWVTLSYGFYGLLLWFPEYFSEKGYSTGSEHTYSVIIAIASIPGYVASAYSVERYGRKLTLLASLFLSSTSIIFFLSASSSSEAVFAASLFNAVSVGAWNVLDIVSTESFPTQVRSAGFGLASVFGRLASIIALFTNGLFLDTEAMMPLFVSATFLALGAAVTFYLPSEFTQKALVDRVE